MTLKLYAHETSTGSGDGSTEEDQQDTDDSQSQEDTQQQEDTSTVPRSELAKANAEAAKYRKRLRETEKRVEELEGHSKTELEKERERASKYEQDLQQANARLLVARAASLAPQGGVSVEAARDAALLLDWDGIEDPDDDNQVVAAFKDLVKEKAYLGRGRGSADGGKGGESGAPESMNSLIRQAAGRE